MEVRISKDEFEEYSAGTSSTATTTQFATISKTPISVLAMCQLMLASVQLVENTVIVSLDKDLFRYEESRVTIRFVWSITVVWMLLIILLLFGIMTNRPLLILPHFFFSIVFLLAKATVLLVLVATASFPFSIIICTVTNVVLILSVHFEWKCFSDMRKYQQQFL